MNNVMLKHTRVMSSNPYVHFVHLGSRPYSDVNNNRAQVFLRIDEADGRAKINPTILSFDWIENNTTRVKFVHMPKIAHLIEYSRDVNPNMDLNHIERLDQVNPYGACVVDQLRKLIPVENIPEKYRPTFMNSRCYIGELEMALVGRKKAGDQYNTDIYIFMTHFDGIPGSLISLSSAEVRERVSIKAEAPPQVYVKGGSRLVTTVYAEGRFAARDCYEVLRDVEPCGVVQFVNGSGEVPAVIGARHRKDYAVLFGADCSAVTSLSYDVKREGLIHFKEPQNSAQAVVDREQRILERNRRLKHAIPLSEQMTEEKRNSHDLSSIVHPKDDPSPWVRLGRHIRDCFNF